MAKKSKRSNDGPHISWRNGRAHADIRPDADTGGCPAARTEQVDWALRGPPAAGMVFGFWYSKSCIVQPRMTFAPARTAWTMFW